MLNLFAVFLGGGIGSVFRFLVSCLFKNTFNFPLATILVNITGCFLMGFFSYYFLIRLNIPNSTKLFFTVGVCGGISTFSAFALESFHYLNTSQYLRFFVYTFISIVAVLISLIIGIAFAKLFIK